MTRTTGALALLCTAIAAAGCSSGPVPTAELAQAHSLVDQAEQSGAPRFDSADLSSARSKLQQADMDSKKEPTRSLAEAQEATADARVALARTNAAKAQAALHDVQAGTRDLQHETDRQELQDETATPANAAPIPQ